MTNNKQQTAVEWLLNAIETKNGEEFSSYYTEFIEQAKEMEKEQKRIKLPSHYEILNKADEEDDKGKHYAFIRGAKWMRDKIQGCEQ
jgi:ADP-heptose:LPS heptosyltransferase